MFFYLFYLTGIVVFAYAIYLGVAKAGWSVTRGEAIVWFISAFVPIGNLVVGLLMISFIVDYYNLNIIPGGNSIRRWWNHVIVKERDL